MHFHLHVLQVPSQEDPGEGTDPLPNPPNADVSDSDDKQLATVEDEAVTCRTVRQAQAEADLLHQQSWCPGFGHQSLMNRL